MGLKLHGEDTRRLLVTELDSPGHGWLSWNWPWRAWMIFSYEEPGFQAKYNNFGFHFVPILKRSAWDHVGAKYVDWSKMLLENVGQY